MRRFSCRLCALASLLIVLWPARPAARPRYGGTLTVEMPVSIRTLDPSDWPAEPAESAACAKIAPLVFETLVRFDASGQVQPLLAESWQHDPQSRTWRFRLRAGVRLHDGSLLTPAQVAAALRKTAEGWTVREDPDGLAIDAPGSMPSLLRDLAEPRRAIVVAGGAGAPVGSGPFRVERWEGPRRAVLRAHDDYWGGRPFLDAVRIEMGRAPRDELLDLELGRADVVSVTPQDVRLLGQHGLRVVSTPALELMALVVDPGRRAPDERVQEALTLAVDRTAIANVLLQRTGEPAHSLLPQWVSGYAFLFASSYDPGRARQAIQKVPLTSRTLSLRLDTADPLAQAVGERIAVNARDVGLTISSAGPAGQQSGAMAAGPIVRLVRARFDPSAPDRVLAQLISRLGVPNAALAETGMTLEGLYGLERSLVDRRAVIPLVHLSELYALGARVESWNGPILLPSGAWALPDVWLKPEKP
jgi:peptide/nickel transport system substrate-binding protein